MVHQIDVADELHVDPPPIGGFQRLFFVADVFLLPQFRKAGLVGDDILEGFHFPDLLPEDFIARATQ